MFVRPTPAAVLTAGILFTATPARAHDASPASRAELDAQRLVVRGKAVGAIGLGAIGLGGFLLVGGLASSGPGFEDDGTTGKRLAAGGFAVALTGVFVAVGGVAAYLAGHRRLDRLRRARLTAAWLPGGAGVHFRMAF